MFEDKIKEVEKDILRFDDKFDEDDVNKYAELHIELETLKQCQKEADESLFEWKCKAERSMQGWVENGKKVQQLQKEKSEMIEKIKKAINDKFEEWGGYGDAFGTNSFDDILDTFKAVEK
jgi:hypothetical protein